jgi:PAS domain S-box-containing protein
MYSILKILLLEDSETDAEILERFLKKEIPSCIFRLAMNKTAFLADLDSFNPNLILADNSLPQFNAIEALSIVKEYNPNIPFIMVTGAVSEEFAAAIIKSGADDYVLKDRLSRLPKAIDDAVKQRSLEHEKADAIQSLTQSEENLKAIFDSASERFILTDLRGVIKDLNNRAKEFIFMISNQEVKKQQSLFDFIEPSRTDYIENIFANISKGETFQYDRRYNFPEGGYCWIDFNFNPVRQGRDITGICITGRDITDKKIDEQRKEFDRSNMNALINNTNDLMWSVNRDYKLITSNHAFDELVQLISGIRPSPGTNVLKEIFDIERIFRFKLCYDRAFSGESFTEIEYTVIPVEIWSEISFYPIYDDQTVVGTACFSRNITTRKKTEDEIRLFTKRISAILNTLPANITLLDENGVIVEVNESWKKFANENGYSGDNYCIGENYLTVSRKVTGMNDSDGRFVAEGIERVLRNKRKTFEYEYPCDSHDLKRWFRLVATPLQEQEYGGAVVMHIDISDIRRLEQEKLKDITEEQKKITRAMLKGQEKERTRLGQELHDNISQLLAAIKMKLSFCLNHFDKAYPIIGECSEYVQEAIAEARNLSHKMVLPRFEENSFKHSLELLLQKYQNEERNIELETSQMDEKRIAGEVKETLYRIVQEQLNNVEKHAQASQVFIQILTYPTYVAFIVKDNGVGFDINKKRNGIGLANILNRAESYNGSVTILSEPGKGCSLFVEIPIVKQMEVV